METSYEEEGGVAKFTVILSINFQEHYQDTVRLLGGFHKLHLDTQDALNWSTLG